MLARAFVCLFDHFLFRAHAGNDMEAEAVEAELLSRGRSDIRISGSGSGQKQWKWNLKCFDFTDNGGSGKVRVKAEAAAEKRSFISSPPFPATHFLPCHWLGRNARSPPKWAITFK